MHARTGLLLGGCVLAAAATFALAQSTVATKPADAAGWARPIDPTPFERTPARIARGKYLVEGVTPCLFCHSDRDFDKPGGPPKEGMKGAGVVMYDSPDRRVVAPNLTPDVETGAGSWPDDAMARAIREGVGHDGRPLASMWWWAFRRLSDEDVRSIVVYLRTLPPVRNPLPATRISEKERDRLIKRLRPLTEPVPQPDQSTPLARGRYLIGVADCGGCHTAWEAPRNAGLYAGGNLIERAPYKAFSANLTPDPTGMPYDEKTFVTFMRNGKFNTLSPMMPWFVFRNMSDSDLGDVRTAMRRLWPIVHRVNNSEAPTHCPICMQDHGGGSSNAIQPPPRGVAVPRAELEKFVGDYRTRDDGNILRIRMKGDHLVALVDTQEHEMLRLADGRFYEVGGSGVPLRFGLDARGKVVTLAEEEVDDYMYDRVEPPPSKPKE